MIMKRLVITVLFIGAVGFSLSGCGGGPANVAEKFYEALAEGDTAAISMYATERTMAIYGPLIPRMAPFMKESGKARAVSHTIDGDMAAVILRFADSDKDELVTLIKQDGKWLVELQIEPNVGK